MPEIPTSVGHSRFGMIIISLSIYMPHRAVRGIQSSNMISGGCMKSVREGFYLDDCNLPGLSNQMGSARLRIMSTS